MWPTNPFPPAPHLTCPKEPTAGCTLSLSQTQTISTCPKLVPGARAKAQTWGLKGALQGFRVQTRRGVFPS